MSLQSCGAGARQFGVAHARGVTHAREQAARALHAERVDQFLAQQRLRLGVHQQHAVLVQPDLAGLGQKCTRARRSSLAARAMLWSLLMGGTPCLQRAFVGRARCTRLDQDQACRDCDAEAGVHAVDRRWRSALHQMINCACRPSLRVSRNEQEPTAPPAAASLPDTAARPRCRAALAGDCRWRRRCGVAPACMAQLMQSMLTAPAQCEPGAPDGPTTADQETTHEVPRSARRQGQNHSRHRRLGEDVSVPVPVRHRRPGAQRVREGHLLVLRRPALSGAAVSVRHHLGRGLVPGAVAVQQPHLHGAAGARRRPPHHQRLRLHLAGAGEGRRRDRRAGCPTSWSAPATTTRTGTRSRPSGR